MARKETMAAHFVRDNFRAIWPEHVEAFTRLFTRLRHHFDGDLDLMLVLAVIGGRTLPESSVTELGTLDHLTYIDEERHGSSAINLQSVADYTGIPRETVRRKLTVLLEKGWITRDEKGAWQPLQNRAKTCKARRAIQSITWLHCLRHSKQCTAGKNSYRLIRHAR